MDPKLIPDSLSNGFEVRISKSDIKANQLYAKKEKAYLTGVPTVPWLTIYNHEQKPIYHALGYNSYSDKLWQTVIDQNRETGFAPELSDVSPYSTLKPHALPKADFTFVEYYAPWCLNCALMENALDDFKQAHPNLKITHVRIQADTRKMQKRKYRTQICPNSEISAN